jgi:hypothetical protein
MMAVLNVKCNGIQLLTRKGGLDAGEFKPKSAF